MKIIEKNINEIKEYTDNPRINDEAVIPVAESIKAFGFRQPIVVNKDNTIVCGHTRYRAAKHLKLETVPCLIADDLTEDQVKAFRIVENKTNEYSSWLDELLKVEIANININLNKWDFPNLSNVDVPSLTTDLKELAYKEKFGVVIDCKDEAEQKAAFEFVNGAGYSARIVSI